MCWRGGAIGAAPNPRISVSELRAATLQGNIIMLNKMSILLAATAAVALSAGAAIAQPDRNGPNMSVTVGDPGQSVYYGNGYNYGYDDGYARRERNDHHDGDGETARHAPTLQ